MVDESREGATWNGYRDNRTDVGFDIDSIENGTLFVTGEAQRRLGFGARVANSGIVVGELAAYVLFITSTGTIENAAQ